MKNLLTKLSKSFFQDEIVKRLLELENGDKYAIIYLQMQIHATKGYLYQEGSREDLFEALAAKFDENLEDVKFTVNFLIENGLGVMEGGNG